MKNSIKLLALAFVMLLFTGCVKSNVTMKINSDKSMDYTMTIGMSKEIQELAKSNGSEEQADVSSMFSDENKKKAEENGYSVKEFDDGKFNGYTITKHFNNIDELSGDKDYDIAINLTNDSDVKIFKMEKGFLSNTYRAKITYSDSKSLSESVEQYNTEEFKKYLEGLEISFNLELPNKAVSNNATSVDGNKLTWDLTKFDKDAIEFEFKMTNTNNVIILVGGICAAVVIIAGVVVLVLKKKKN